MENIDYAALVERAKRHAVLSDDKSHLICQLAAAPQPPNRQEDCAEPDIDPAFAEAVYGHDLDLTAMVGGAK